jgi:hypothetical protein
MGQLLSFSSHDHMLFTKLLHLDTPFAMTPRATFDSRRNRAAEF